MGPGGSKWRRIGGGRGKQGSMWHLWEGYTVSRGVAHACAMNKWIARQAKQVPQANVSNFTAILREKGANCVHF
jgi:hypothetical protein